MTQAGTTTYEWDAANRLKSVNSSALGSYGYDGNGKRVKKSEGGGTTYYVYSSVLGAAVLEVASTGVQRAYVMNGSAIVAQLNPNGNFYWLHLDHLGSGRKMTDTSGNVVYRAEYEPYGKLAYEWSSTSNLNTKKFTGYERDAATGLDYAQARMYASEWGRFMSPDPTGLRSASPYRPKSLNRYSYVEGNPINLTDPTGLNPYQAGNLGSVTITASANSFITFAGCYTQVVNRQLTFYGNCWCLPQWIQLPYIEQARQQQQRQQQQQAKRTELINKMQTTTKDDINLAADFLEKNPACVTEFETANGGLDLDTALDNLSIHDSKVVDENDKRFWDTKPSDIGDTGPDSNKPLKDLIGPNSQGQAIALWTLSAPMIIVGYNVLTDRSRLIVHEVLHIYFKAGHADIANKLKLTYKPGSNTAETEANASAAINDFIRGGCKR